MKNNSVNVYYSDSCLDLVNTKAIQSKTFPLFVSVLAFPSIQTTVRTEFEHRRTNVEKKKKKNTLRRSALYFTLELCNYLSYCFSLKVKDLHCLD